MANDAKHLDRMLTLDSVSSAVGMPDMPQNLLLASLPADDWQALRAEAERIIVPAGKIVVAPSELKTMFFPETGLISVIAEMVTGHQVDVLTIGSEDLFGAAAICGVPCRDFRGYVHVQSEGYRIPIAHFFDVFNRSESFRSVILDYLGRLLIHLARSGACQRLHSQRQRLALWLLGATDKAGQGWLPITHDVLAQMIGGPRHTVTVALNDLRTKGAISYLRGEIWIVDRETLIEQACECYRWISSGDAAAHTLDETSTSR